MTVEAVAAALRGARAAGRRVGAVLVVSPTYFGVASDIAGKAKSAWRGAVRRGVVWYGAVWRGVVWCSVCVVGRWVEWVGRCRRLHGGFGFPSWCTACAQPGGAVNHCAAVRCIPCPTALP